MGVPNNVIIIGTGVFGISTSISLAKKYPEINIHVIDRFEPPVEDSTSVDYSRCIRIDYNDPTYFKLAYEGLELIKADPIISHYFHQRGMVTFYDGKSGKWEDVLNSEKKCAEKAWIDRPEMIVCSDTPEDVFQSIHGVNAVRKTEKELGRKTWWNKGYCNLGNGFIDARKSMKAFYERAKTYPNIKFTFKEVEKINYYPGTKKAKGVLFVDGTVANSDVVIVAAGAWSGKLVNLRNVCKSSAIEVAWFKITKEEEEKWKNMSISGNLSTGINMFPPYNGDIKILRRSAGFKNTIEIPNPDPLVKENISISYPRTAAKNPFDWIPKDAEIALRENMKDIMPALANRPFTRTALCWLTQTPSANFLIDYHPDLENVILATGGSAHAWKFVFLIGDKVLDLMNGELDSVLRNLWSYEEKLANAKDNGSAPRMEGEPQELRGIIRTQPGSKL